MAASEIPQCHLTPIQPALLHVRYRACVTAVDEVKELNCSVCVTDNTVLIQLILRRQHDILKHTGTTLGHLFETTMGGIFFAALWRDPSVKSAAPLTFWLS